MGFGKSLVMYALSLQLNFFTLEVSNISLANTLSQEDITNDFYFFKFLTLPDINTSNRANFFQWNEVDTYQQSNSYGMRMNKVT